MPFPKDPNMIRATVFASGQYGTELDIVDPEFPAVSCETTHIQIDLKLYPSTCTMVPGINVLLKSVWYQTCKKA